MVFVQPLLQIVVLIVDCRTFGFSLPGVIAGSGRTSSGTGVVVVVELVLVIVVVLVDSVAVVAVELDSGTVVVAIGDAARQ
jgi:hypothetical protein